MGSKENAEQLMIALEPEAAAIFCQENNLSDFYSETGSRSVDGILSQPDTHYMVVDIGGTFFIVATLTNLFKTPSKLETFFGTYLKTIWQYLSIYCSYHPTIFQ